MSIHDKDLGEILGDSRPQTDLDDVISRIEASEEILGDEIKKMKFYIELLAVGIIVILFKMFF